MYGRELDPFSLRVYLAVRCIMAAVGKGGYTPELLRGEFRKSLFARPELASERLIDMGTIGALIPILTVENGERVNFE